MSADVVVCAGCDTGTCPVACLFAQITAQLIEDIESGSAGTWRMPWHTLADAGTPESVDGRRDRGLNSIWLSMVAAGRGWTSGIWGTYRTWQRHGDQVRRGDRATQVVLWKQTRPADDDNQSDNADEPRRRPRMFARVYAVFAAEQVDGAADIVARRQQLTRDTPDRIDAAGHYFTAIGAHVIHAGNRAYYQPATDEIHVPDLDRFDQAQHYYATLAHPIPARRPRPSSNGKSRCPCDVLSAGIITRCRWAEVAQLCLPRRRCYERGCVAPWATPAGRSNRAVTPTRCATVLTRVCLPALARRALTCGVAQPGGVNSGATTMFCSEVIDQRSAFGPAYSGSS